MLQRDAIKPRVSVRVAIIFTSVFVLGTACLLRELSAQQGTAEHIGLPVDWSSRHVLFTNNGNPELAAAVASDPRSWINWAERSGYLFAGGARSQGGAPRRHIHRDWAMSLGANGGMAVGESPAKYSFSINQWSCANDYMVYTIDATPSATQANIVALNNLYTGTTSSSCPYGPGDPRNYTQPTWMWSYRAGTGASFLSPTLSLDGKHVVFIEDGVGAPAWFDTLTPVAGQGTDATHPVTPGSNGSSLTRLSYTTSTATGCNASASNSNSSAYIDYSNDTAYVGADNGILYRIHPVFNGTPAVQYCVTVKANALLTSPVYDQISNQVFVSDGFSLYSFTPGGSGFTSGGSVTLASNAARDPIVLSPIVDTTNGFVYVFSGADLTNTHSLAVQLTVGLTHTVTVPIGLNNTQFILDGDFDEPYFAVGPQAGSGTLYVCGTQSNNGTKPSLYALSFLAPNGYMNTVPAMSDNRKINGVANPAGTCSPLLEFFDGTNDRLYVGTGNYTGTGGANMVTEWNVNTRLTGASNPGATATNEWGGTSAFTIDNVSPIPQASSIYFGTLRPPRTGTNPCGAGNFCAVKLTQSALQ